MFKIWGGEEVLTILIPKETFGNLGREAYCHSKAYYRVLGEEKQGRCVPMDGLEQDREALVCCGLRSFSSGNHNTESQGCGGDQTSV